MADETLEELAELAFGGAKPKVPIREPEPAAPPESVRRAPDEPARISRPVGFLAAELENLSRNPISGREEWADEKVPLEERLGDFIRSQAQFRSGKGLVANGWNATAQEVKKRFPGVDVDKLEGSYQNEIKLGRARKKYEGMEETKLAFLLRRSIPVTSAVVNLAESSNYKNALDRINKGEAKEKDYDTVALFELLQDNEQRKGVGGAAVDALARLPAIAGEAMLGGSALRGLGMAAPAAGTSAAVQAGTRPLATQALIGTGRVAATTALMPSMYLPEAGQRALQNGGEWSDLKNLAPSYGLGMAYTAILGQTAGKLPGIAKSWAGRVGAGLAETQVVDAAAGAVGLRTSYGVVGDLLEGKTDEALKHATAQMVTFGFFGLMHGRNHITPLAEAYKDALGSLKSKGLNSRGANQRLLELHDTFGKALAENPALTRAEAKELFKEVPDPKLRAYGEQIAEQVPERGVPQAAPVEEARPAEEQRQPEPEPRPAEPEQRAAPLTPQETEAARARLEEQTPRTEAPLTPEQAGQAVEAEAARMQAEGRNAARRPEQEPARPPEAPPAAERAEPAPEPTRPAEPAPEPARGAERRTLAELRERFQSDQPVKLEEVFEAADLNRREQHVMRERLAGRSHADIAADEMLLKKDGKRYTRQRIEQIEAKALEKLGVDASVAKEVHAVEKADNAVDMAEQGRRVSVGDLQADPKTVEQRSSKRVSAVDRIDAEMERLADAYIKESENAGTRGLSAKREAYYRAEFSRLDRESKGGASPAETESPGIRRGVPEGVGGVAAEPEAARPTARPAAVEPPAPKNRGKKPAPRRRAESEYARQNRQRREAGAWTLADEVRKRGGLDPASLEQSGLDRRYWEQSLGKGVFTDKANSRGKLKLDQVAEEFANNRKIPPVPRDVSPGEHLLNLLRDHHMIDPGKWLDRQAEAAVARQSEARPTTPAEALEAMRIGDMERVGGVMVRRTGPAEYRVEVDADRTVSMVGQTGQERQAGVIRGDAPKMLAHIESIAKLDAMHGKARTEALARADAYPEPSFMDEAGMERAQRGFEKLPVGARVVSLEEGTRGRVGEVVADANGVKRVKLEGESGWVSSFVEPLEAKYSWRVDRSAEPARPKQANLFEAEIGPPQEVAPGVMFTGLPLRLTVLDRVLGKGAPTVRAVADWLGSFLRARGDLPPAAFREKVANDGRIAAAAERIRQADRDLRKATGPYDRVPQEYILAMDRALHGEWAALDQLPPAVRQRVEPVLRGMRDHVDLLSTSLVQSGAVSERMGVTIDANMGTYLTRQYRVFTDPKWEKNVPVEVVNRFKSWLIAERNAEGRPATQQEVDALTDALLYNGKAAENPIAFLSGKKLGSKDLKILVQRKALPVELRELWGEFRDPLINYANSVARMSNILSNHLFLTRVRQQGMGRFLFERPVEGAKAQIAAEGSEVMNPLNGLWTFPEVKKAFEAVYAKQELPWYLRTYMGALIGPSKYAKTVLSHITHIRNFTSNAGFALANGHWRVNKMAPALKNLVKDTPEAREYYLRATELGLIGDSVNANEVKLFIQDVLNQRETTAAEALGMASDRGLFRFLKKGLKATEKLYHAEDAVWKLYAFENEKTRYAEAHPEWSKEQVEQYAATIVRDTYPTYSMVGKAVKGVRRLPLVGPFVSFPAEVVRTAGNTIMLGWKEMQDPRTRAIGAQRLAGSLAATTAAFTAAMISRSLLGLTADDEKEMRRFMPEWSKDSPILHLGKNDKGEYRYLDLGYSDPYAYLKQPLIAAWRGENPEQKLKQALWAVSRPFLSEELVTKQLGDVWRNQTADSQQVFNPRDPDRYMAGAAHVGEALTPGSYTAGARLLRAARGEPEKKSGQVNSLEDEAKANLTGQRVGTLNLERSLRLKAGKFDQGKEDVTKLLTSVARQRGVISDKDLALAYQKMEAQRRKLYDEMRADVLAAQKLGMGRRKAIALLEEAGMSADDQRAVMDGHYQPYLLDPEQLRPKSAAGMIPGDLTPAEAQRRAKVLLEQTRAYRMAR